jgi:hypothetical protein
VASVVLLSALPACQSTATTTQLPPPATQPLVAASQPGLSVTLPAEVAAAIDALASDDDALRDQALAVLADSAATYAGDSTLILELTADIQRHTAAQMATLLRVHDPESQARLMRLLAFENGLAAFICDALQQPKERRAELLTWGLSSDPLPSGVAASNQPGTIPATLVGLTYSTRSSDQLQAAHLIAEVSDPKADMLLSRLLLDPDREISLTALDTAWDRPMSPVLVDALWVKAVVLPLRVQMGGGGGMFFANGPFIGPQQAFAMQGDFSGPGQGAVRHVKVGPRHFDISNSNDSNLWMQVADSSLAVDILLASKSPLVEQKLDDFLSNIVDNHQPTPNGVSLSAMLLSPNYGQAGAQFQRLLEAYKPRAGVFLAAQMVIAGPADGWENNFGAGPVRISKRIDALGVLTQMLDLDKDDYKLTRSVQYGNRWAIAGTVTEEEAAVSKFRSWWKDHKSEYELKK